MRLALVLVLICSGLSSSALAQAEPPPRYVELIESALSESEAARWQEARALFRQAHELYPNARTLRGMGMVSFELRDYVDTVRHLRAALREDRRALEPAQRAEVQKTLDQALSFVARYDVSGAPRDITWTIDGKRVEVESDGILLVPLGDHTIGVARGSQSGSAHVTIQGGEQEVFPVEFEEPSPTAGTGAPVTTLGGQAASQPEPTAVERPFPWTSTIITATGGVMLIVGTILFVSGMADVSTVEDAPMGTPWSDVQSANDRAPIFTGVGLGLVAAGAVVTSVGIIGLTMGDDDRDGSVDRAGLAVQAWF